MCEQKLVSQAGNTAAMSVSTPRTLTPKEVQEILQIGTNNVYTLLHSKAFPVIRIGRSYRIPAEPFYTWLSESHSVDC